jgi:hypothetical protein
MGNARLPLRSAPAGERPPRTAAAPAAGAKKAPWAK